MKAARFPSLLLLLGFLVSFPGSALGAVAISAIGNVAISEDAVAGPIAFSVTGFQTRQPTVSARSDAASLVPASGISLSGSGGSWTITVTPAANQNGVANITVTATDGFTTDTEAFSVTVRAVNDPPTVTDIGNRTIDEDGTLGPIAFTIGDPDVGAQLTITTSSSNTELVPLSRISVGGSGFNRTLTVTPTANLSGNSLIGIFVSDGSLSATTRFT
ncbi:MAG: hypothetical protein JNL97_17985, partial [Verrucomicrobiales bacterium]|nr:hypothetical protein [Verrucomicrobiales bacterium]